MNTNLLDFAFPSMKKGSQSSPKLSSFEENDQELFCDFNDDFIDLEEKFTSKDYSTPHKLTKEHNSPPEPPISLSQALDQIQKLERENLKLQEELSQFQQFNPDEIAQLESQILTLTKQNSGLRRHHEVQKRASQKELTSKNDEIEKLKKENTKIQLTLQEVVKKAKQIKSQNTEILKQNSNLQKELVQYQQKNLEMTSLISSLQKK